MKYIYLISAWLIFIAVCYVTMHYRDDFASNVVAWSLIGIQLIILKIVVDSG